MYKMCNLFILKSNVSLLMILQFTKKVKKKKKIEKEENQTKIIDFYVS